MRLETLWVWAAVCALGFPPANLFAQAPPPKQPPKPPVAAAEPPLYYLADEDASVKQFDTQLRAALDKTYSDWKYVETPLKDVAEDLTKRLGVQVDLDNPGLDEVGVNGDTPITFSALKLSGRTALGRLLGDHGLTFAPLDAKLLLTNPDRAATAKFLVTRIYPVADLVEAGDEWDHVRDFGSLIDLITTSIQPNGWASLGGPGAIEVSGENAFVIALPYTTHYELERFLSELRRASKEFKADPKRVSTAAFDVRGTEAIRKSLDAVDSYRFEGSLSEFAELMTSTIGKHVGWIARDLDEIGVANDVVIKGRYEKVTVRQGLRSMLRPHQLTFYLSGDSLTITSDNAASKPENLAFRIFPLWDLPDRDNLVQAITKGSGMEHWADVGGPGSIEVYNPIPVAVVRASEEVMDKVAAIIASTRQFHEWQLKFPDYAARMEYSQRVFTITFRPKRAATDDASTLPDPADARTPATPADMTELQAFLKRNIAPESWLNKEVRLDTYRNRLFVRQKPEVVIATDKLLRKLRLIGLEPNSSP